MKELFADFPPKDKSHWIEKICKDLKLTEAKEVIEQPLGHGIVQPAYCDFSDPEPTLLQQSYAQCKLNEPHEWQGSRFWMNIERLQGADAAALNKTGLRALQGGADGLEWVTPSTNWTQLFANISIPHCHLALEGSFEQSCDFVTFLNQMKVPGLQGHVTIVELPKTSAVSLCELINQLEIHPRFRCLVIEEAGYEVGSLQEISVLLSKCIMLINRLLDGGASLEQLAQNLQIHIELSDAYLWEICRLRALRILFHQIIRQYGYRDFGPGELVIKATASRGPQEEDPNQQLLRNTTQAMAAVLGGCDLLSTLPHEQGFASTREDERRIARNVGLILREESYLHKVADPVAGSYYMEALTHKMLEAIWENFRKMEARGGYITNIKNHD